MTDPVPPNRLPNPSPHLRPKAFYPELPPGWGGKIERTYKRLGVVVLPSTVIRLGKYFLKHGFIPIEFTSYQLAESYAHLFPIDPDMRDLTDHVHDAAREEDGSFVPCVEFDYEALDAEMETETLVSFSALSSAFMCILDWLCASRDFRFAGAKVHCLRMLLDPVNGDYRTIRQVAKAAKVSRASLSKSYVLLRDEYGIRLTGGKLDSSRASFANTQFRLVAEGRHASQRVRQAKANGNGNGKEKGNGHGSR